MVPALQIASWKKFQKIILKIKMIIYIIDAI